MAIDKNFLTLAEIQNSIANFTGVNANKPVNLNFGAEHASTDGNTIHLPNVDPKDAAATTILFGHAVHEIAHVLYSEFECLEDCKSFKPLVNVLEDIRIDKAMADRCPGSYLMRRDLYETFAKLGKLPLAKEEDSPLRLLCLALYWNLVDKVHRFHLTDLPIQQTETVFCKKYGRALFTRLCNMAEPAVNASCTAEIIEIARKILAKFVPAGCPSAPKEIASMGTNPRLSPVEQKFAEKKAEKFLEAAFADCHDLDLGKNCEQLLDSKQCAEDFSSEESYGFAVWTVKRDEFMRETPGNFLAEARELCGLHSNKLRRFFQAKTLTDSLRGRTGSCIDYPVLSRINVGDSRVFKKENFEIQESAACAVLLDRSGSMTQEMLEKAKLCAYSVAEMFESLEGCVSSCYAFPGLTRKTLLEVKNFNDTCRRTVSRFASIKAFGFTPVVESLNTAAVQLSMRPEAKKIIFIITDGLCPEADKIEKTASLLENKGFEILCINIGDDVERLFKYQETITEVNQLAPKVFQLLSNYWSKEDQIRRQNLS